MLAEQAVKAINISLALRNRCLAAYLAGFEQRGATAPRTAQQRQVIGESSLADFSNQLFVSRQQVQQPGKELMAAFMQRAFAELTADRSDSP